MPFFDCLPAYVLNRSPRIIASFDTDFLRNLDAFRRALPRGGSFTLLLQMGWSVHEPKFAEELKSRMAEARNAFPEARFVFLANEASALPVLEGMAECILCSHNALLDPCRYPLAGGKRLFDAIYVARITPFKRHALAAKVRNLHLIGSHSQREEEYFQSVMRTVPYARWDEKVNSLLIGRHIARAHCGLALSSIEGAMFACGEYSLCGIPVVNTENVGGRDSLLPDFAAFKAEDTPESVAAGVEYWKTNPVPPQEIREAFLKMAQEHRSRLEELLASIAGKRVSLPHKLGIRCHLLPHQKLLHGIRRR